MNVYLAGPIRGLTFDDAVNWREEAKERLNAMGLVGVSPMRGKDYLRDKGPLLGDRGSGAFEEFPMSSEQGIFGRDVFDVTRCDILLANFEYANEMSVGTAMEIQRAYDVGTYVLTVLKDGAVHDHPFIRRASSLVVPTLEYAYTVLEVLTAPYVDKPVPQQPRPGFVQLPKDNVVPIRRTQLTGDMFGRRWADEPITGRKI